MNQPQHIVILGGGTAGWLTACIVAAEHRASLEQPSALHITLVESSTIPTIGVGEGTWPSMRHTLQRIGISETAFLLACDVSPKQGSCFRHWRQPAANQQPHQYLHPFTAPVAYPELCLVERWLAQADAVDALSFAEVVCPQTTLSLQGKAPKTIGTPDYHLIQNYGYHLNAMKFAQLLQQHAVSELGVHWLQDEVVDVVHADGLIQSLVLAANGPVAADFFIDCSGARSRLLGDALQEKFVSAKQSLCNNRALALQLPYQLLAEPTEVAASNPIASNTVATAQTSGWIWDISLPTRAGIGHVFADEFTNEAEVEQRLLAYASTRLANSDPVFAKATPHEKQQALSGLSLKSLSFTPGHYQRCWVGNCMAIGMAAGFIEPLEASALALVEWSAKTIAKALPLHPCARDLQASRVNAQFRQHWADIIDFLQLHYVLSGRPEPYWLAQRQQQSARLRDWLALWQYQWPEPDDFQSRDALFPAASYQYVLYGMGFRPTWLRPLKSHEQAKAAPLLRKVWHDIQQLQQLLPNNAQLLTQVRQQGFSRR